jgi:molecular chaperone DnaK (HSP70)
VTRKHPLSSHESHVLTPKKSHLGGQDFDTNLLDHFKKEFTRKTKKVSGCILHHWSTRCVENARQAGIARDFTC